MIDTSRGKILMAADYGSVWQIFYKVDGGLLGLVTFDHRPFASFYEGATHRSFYEDYKFGSGRQFISDRLKGLRISVEGEQFSEVVSLEGE